MSVTSNNQRFNKVLENISADAVSTIGILAADFKTIEISLNFSGAANMDIQVLGSDQTEFPNAVQPNSPTNQLFDLGYLDSTSLAQYNVSSPYNPGGSSPSETKKFHIQSEGTRWVFLRVFNYSAGSLDQADVSLFQQS